MSACLEVHDGSGAQARDARQVLGVRVAEPIQEPAIGVGDLGHAAAIPQYFTAGKPYPQKVAGGESPPAGYASSMSGIAFVLDRLEKIQAARGYSVEGWARDAGLGERTYAAILKRGREEGASPRLDVVNQLCDYADIPLWVVLHPDELAFDAYLVRGEEAAMTNDLTLQMLRRLDQHLERLNSMVGEQLLLARQTAGVEAPAEQSPPEPDPRPAPARVVPIRQRKRDR